MQCQVVPNTPNFVAAVLRFVSRYSPFRGYQFGQMVEALVYQLRGGTNVVAIDDGRLVGYMGWIRTTEAIAERWMHDEGPLTPAGSGNAVVATVLVAKNRSSIFPMIRRFAELNPACRVYRKRSFPDGRPAMKRPPISVRGQRRKILE